MFQRLAVTYLLPKTPAAPRLAMQTFRGALALPQLTPSAGVCSCGKTSPLATWESVFGGADPGWVFGFSGVDGSTLEICTFCSMACARGVDIEPIDCGCSIPECGHAGSTFELAEQPDGELLVKPPPGWFVTLSDADHDGLEFLFFSSAACAESAIHTLWSGYAAKA